MLTLDPRMAGHTNVHDQILRGNLGDGLQDMFKDVKPV